MNEKNNTSLGTPPDAGMKTYTVHVQETQEAWGVVTVRARSPEEAEELAEDAFDPDHDWHHGTSRIEAMALTENGEPRLAGSGRPGAEGPAASAGEVPPSVAAAVRAVVGLYLEDEARDFLGHDQATRATHVFPHLVVLARYATPEFLDILTGDPDVLQSLCDTK